MELLGVNIYVQTHRQGNKMNDLLDLWFLIKNNFSLSLNVFSFIKNSTCTLQTK